MTTTNPVTVANSGLPSKALIVSVHISTWSGRKYDSKATRQVEQAHNAQAGEAGRFNKMLTSKEFLAGVTTAAGAARSYLYDKALPWSDNGDRLLPSAIYFDFVQDFQTYVDKFNAEVDKAEAEFEAMKIEAETRLNGLYNPADYPSQAEFRSKFSLRVSFMPIPETQDFRLDINETEVNTLRITIETEMNNRLAATVSNIWERVKKQLTHMKERLTEISKAKDGSDRPATFRDSLFDNLSDLIDLIPKLNVTGSPEIDALCEDLKAVLIDPEKVRQSIQIRHRKAEEVDDIMKKFDGFFS